MLSDFLNKYVLAGDGDTAKPAAPAAAPATQALGAAPSTVAASNEFVTALRNAIKARSTVYTALLQAADKLVSIIPDPNTRLKAAFASVQGEGRGLREVIGALDVHVADLESQRMQFGQALAKQREAAVGVLQRELDGLKPANDTAAQQIQAMTAQIQQLQTLITTNTTRAAELQGQITAQTMQFTQTEQQFVSALQIVKSELDGQKAAVMSVLS